GGGFHFGRPLRSALRIPRSPRGQRLKNADLINLVVALGNHEGGFYRDVIHGGLRCFNSRGGVSACGDSATAITALSNTLRKADRIRKVMVPRRAKCENANIRHKN